MEYCSDCSNPSEVFVSVPGVTRRGQTRSVYKRQMLKLQPKTRSDVIPEIKRIFLSVLLM